MGGRRPTTLPTVAKTFTVSSRSRARVRALQVGPSDPYNASFQKGNTNESAVDCHDGPFARCMRTGDRRADLDFELVGSRWGGLARPEPSVQRSHPHHRHWRDDCGYGPDPGSPEYSAGTVTVNAILAAIPDVTSKVAIDGSQLVDPTAVTATNPQGYVNVSSAHITESNWLALAKATNQALNDDNYDAVIIPHGTDSMEETAYFLQLTVNSPKPVILVGAMRPAVGSTDPDGPDNIRTAVRVALDPQAQGKGVMIVQNFTVVPAYDVVKVQSYTPTISLTHEQLPCPFTAPTYGDYGNVLKLGSNFADWAVVWNGRNALLGQDAKALSIKFDVSNVSWLRSRRWPCSPRPWASTP